MGESDRATSKLIVGIRTALGMLTSSTPFSRRRIRGLSPWRPGSKST
jgi:hypothetical protein